MRQQWLNTGSGSETFVDLAADVVVDVIAGEVADILVVEEVVMEEIVRSLVVEEVVVEKIVQIFGC